MKYPRRWSWIMSPFFIEAMAGSPNISVSCYETQKRRHYIRFSLRWPTAVQIYWNKRDQALSAPQKIARISKSRTNGGEICWESLQSFRIANHLTENLGIPREAVISVGNSGNDVPFVSGNFRKFKPEWLIEWKAPSVY